MTRPDRDDLPKKGRLTYRDAGVDADRADSLVERIGLLARGTHRPGVVAGVGGFASLFSLKEAVKAETGSDALRDPLLVAGTDGVGTKLKIAFMMDRHDTVGMDLVAMCVNDVVTTGARPLFFLDYFATGKLDEARAEAVIRGIAEGCHLAECALVGGETAEMPGLYLEGEYDLAGFAVGIVEREKVIDGRRVRPGDTVLGIQSRGLHSNGYSLARKALFERGRLGPEDCPDGLSRSLGEELLEPTAIYARLVRNLVSSVEVKALAHITGGGIPGNLPRVLPRGLRAVVERRTWKPHAIFGCIQRAGHIADDEMFRTFNMGVGLIAVVSPSEHEKALAVIAAAGEAAMVIGEIRGAPSAEVEAYVELR